MKVGSGVVGDGAVRGPGRTPENGMERQLGADGVRNARGEGLSSGRPTPLPNDTSPWPREGGARPARELRSTRVVVFRPSRAGGTTLSCEASRLRLASRYLGGLYGVTRGYLVRDGKARRTRTLRRSRHRARIGRQRKRRLDGGTDRPGGRGAAAGGHQRLVALPRLREGTGGRSTFEMNCTCLGGRGFAGRWSAGGTMLASAWQRSVSSPRAWAVASRQPKRLSAPPEDASLHAKGGIRSSAPVRARCRRR